MSDIELYPCYDNELIPLTNSKGRQLYHVRAKGKSLASLMTLNKVRNIVIELTGHFNIKIVDNVPCMVRVVSGISKDLCVHKYIIRGSRGKCTMCGEKKKFINKWQKLESTMFVYLTPCFDEAGYSISYEGEDLYHLGIKYGINPILDTKHIITEDNLEHMIDYYYNQNEDSHYVQTIYKQDAFILSHLHKGWKRSTKRVNRKYIEVMQVYKLEHFGYNTITELTPEEITRLVKRAIADFRKKFGEPKIAIFNDKVPDIAIKHFGGKLGVTNTKILCCLGNLVKPIEKVKGAVKIWQILKDRKITHTQKSMLNSY